MHRDWPQPQDVRPTRRSIRAARSHLLRKLTTCVFPMILVVSCYHTALARDRPHLARPAADSPDHRPKPPDRPHAPRDEKTRGMRPGGRYTCVPTPGIKNRQQWLVSERLFAQSNTDRAITRSVQRHFSIGQPPMARHTASAQPNSRGFICLRITGSVILSSSISNNALLRTSDRIGSPSKGKVIRRDLPRSGTMQMCC